jgi:carbon monoxide dehydrogenase subunit G
MVDVQRTFTVNKPIGIVVEYLADFSHAQAWDPGTVSCTSTDSGPVQVGSTWHNVSEIKGHQTELTYTLKRWEDDHLTFVGENNSATSTDDLTFVAEGERTTITYRAVIEFHGLAKVIGMFAHPEFEKLGDATEKQLTSTLEGL